MLQKNFWSPPLYLICLLSSSFFYPWHHWWFTPTLSPPSSSLNSVALTNVKLNNHVASLMNAKQIFICKYLCRFSSLYDFQISLEGCFIIITYHMHECVKEEKRKKMFHVFSPQCLFIKQTFGKIEENSLYI